MANEPAVQVLDHFAHVCGDLEKLLMNFLLIGIFLFWRGLCRCTRVCGSPSLKISRAIYLLLWHNLTLIWSHFILSLKRWWFPSVHFWPLITPKSIFACIGRPTRISNAENWDLGTVKWLTVCFLRVLQPRGEQSWITEEQVRKKLIISELSRSTRGCRKPASSDAAVHANPLPLCVTPANNAVCLTVSHRYRWEQHQDHLCTDLLQFPPLNTQMRCKYTVKGSSPTNPSCTCCSSHKDC